MALLEAFELDPIYDEPRISGVAARHRCGTAAH
jgi:hypothetical protein